jgi:hypothetical protein
VVKKKATKKTAPKAKSRKKAPPRRKADRSRIDLGPLKDHIRRRIKELKEGGPYAAEVAAAGRTPDDTVERLQQALETLSDICYPAMAIPI